MLIMPREALHFGQFCGMARGACAAVLGQHGTRAAACGRGAGSAGCSPARPPLWLRLPGVPLRLTPQVGAGDHAGQDAQPRLHRLFLRVGVLRVVPLGVFLPNVPGLRLLDFRLLPEGRSSLFLPVSFRISSRCACVMGSPCRAWVRVPRSCRSPRIGLGRRRRRQRRKGV